MGVGGNFWDVLKPCARHEGADWLRDKCVAVDLPFWIVAHDTAIRARLPRARNPHLRTTFFRSIALFSKMGAYPVFVVDGNPSPMKSQARIERFFRSSGLDPSELPSSLIASEGETQTNSVKRNPVFAKYIQQCIELVELLGMPVLKAQSEAEALCAQLNYEGHVDACITSDSDAFLFGAKCVIKSFNSNSKEPFECYYLSDIESKIGLKRNKMIAFALLAGNDFSLNGVPGFGSENSLRLVRLFNEHDIFDRLREIGEGKFPLLTNENNESDNFANETLKSLRISHCSNCGHPGTQKTHRNVACEYCFINNDNNDKWESCVEKPSGFKCICSACDEERKLKEKKRQENWQIKFFEKIASESNFPNEEIINLYLKENHGDYKENGGPNLKWENPKIEELIDFLNYYQNWDPSYIRQRIFPMLTTIYLRNISLNNDYNSTLIYDQFEFDSVKRVKIRCGYPYYLVKWKKNGSKLKDINGSEEEIIDLNPIENSGSDLDLFNELDQVEVSENEGIILTEENIELVRAAFPEEIQRLEKEQRLKERKSNKSSGSTQLNITEFFKSTKSRGTGDSSSIGEIQKLKRGKEKAALDLDKNLPKSVRRKLLFN